jgi:WD40 repeat protein
MADWNPEANAIFLKVVETSSREAQLALLEAECDGNAELRAQVEGLLKANEQAGSFLDAPATGLSASTDPSVQPGPAMVTGPYQQVPASSENLSQPPAVPGYAIEKVLGRGGMGVVYKAQHLALKRTVALKMVLAGGHAGPQEMARFRFEAEAVARLQHPNIVQIHEVGEADGYPYFALEFVEGGSLAQKLAGKPLPVRAAARLVEVLARAMQLAHSRNVVHRDLKPANVLLTADGTPKVTDFGLARQLDSDSGETQAGAIMGTPSYMAPEQASGRTHDAGPAADVYALGALLYECLVGRPPFKATTVGETLEQVRTREPMPPSRVQAKVPVDLETICLKCLRKEPEKRYASAAELADELGRFLQGEPILGRPVGRRERAAKWVRRNKGLSAGLAAAVLALLVGTGLAVWQAVEARIAADNEASQKKEAQKQTTIAKAALTRVNKGKKAAVAARKTAEEQRDRADLLVYASKLAQAQLEFKNYNAPHGLRLLEECPRNLRKWEHRHLCARFNSKQTFLGHSGVVTGVCFSPDGTRLASATFRFGPNPGQVKVWDVQKGQEVLNLKGHTGSVCSVCFSPDGKRLASAGGTYPAQTGEVKVWDAQTGQEVLALRGNPRSVTSVCFSPDGKRLATAGADGTMRVWDAGTGQLVRARRVHADMVMSVCFSPDGKHLATASFDKTAKLWDAKTGQEVFVLKGHASFVSWVCFSPNSRLLASSSADSTVMLWDVSTGQKILPLKGHKSRVHSVCFSPDGKRLASASDDRTVRVWDAANGQEVFILQGHTHFVWSVAFSPDGKKLASGSFDKTLKVWDAALGQEVRVFKGHTGIVWSVCFSRDGKRLASASQDRMVKVWDAATGKEVRTFKGHTSPVTSVCFSPDGQRAASTAGQAKLGGPAKPDQPRVWDVTTGRELFTLKGHTKPVQSVAWGPNGKRLASASQDGTVKVWDAATGREILTLKGHTSPVDTVCFSPDGKRLAVASGDGTKVGKPGQVKVWDAVEGREVFTLKGHASDVNCVCFSRNGKRLASASSDNTVKVWDAEKGRELLTLRGHTGWGHTGHVSGVCFSPDGKRLASAGFDSTVRIWEAEKGQEILVLKWTNREFTVPITSVCFSPDGKRLAAASYEGTVKVWDAEKGQEVRGQEEQISAAAFPPRWLPPGRPRRSPPAHHRRAPGKSFLAARATRTHFSH